MKMRSKENMEENERKKIKIKRLKNLKLINYFYILFYIYFDLFFY